VLNNDVLLLLTNFMKTPAELANFVRLKKHLAPLVARTLYRNVELKSWRQGYDFFETINTTSTTLYSVTELVENVQLAFVLTLPNTGGISKEEGEAESWKFIQFMDFMQFGLPSLTKLHSLNVFIDSTKKDPFGLIRMANILHNDSPPQPIILRLKNLIGDKSGQVCTKLDIRALFC
jgi:hypothetical protein